MFYFDLILLSVPDVRLREFLEALETYATKHENAQSRDHTRHQLRSSEDNSLEEDELGEENENNAERQTILVGNNTYKPKNIHVNTDQVDDDRRDVHPKPPVRMPVVGVKKSIQTRNFGISSSFLWPNGIIPYEIDADSFGAKSILVTKLVEVTIARIESTTCVKWRPRTSEERYFVRIKGNENGCWSYVGNVGFGGGQDLNLGDGCLDLYIVLHEFHHAMGGLHEQQRSKRKYFVKINWENIDRANNDQFTLNAHTRNSQVYDYASILQYHLTAFTSNGKDTMSIPDQDLEYLISNSKHFLSYYDIAEINEAYNCPSSSCSVSCQNEGFRMQTVYQTTCRCHCPSGLTGPTCEVLDSDADCGKFIHLSNGVFEEIKMTSYTPGKLCSWVFKGESDSIIKATVTSIDLPFSSQNDCYHWLEFRDYLIGDPGKQLCGKSTSPKTYTQAQIGKVSPFLMRFNSKKSYAPGTGFTVKVEAIKSGCLSSPCQTGSLCTEGPGDGTYTCACENGLSGTICDQFRAPSYNFCDLEDDFGTCLFDQDPSSEIRWSFNTRLCDPAGCESGVLTRESQYQFLTLTPYYDGIPWTYGSIAAIITTANFTAVDRCLSFMYAFGTYEGFYSTQIHVFMEGTGMHRGKIRTYYGSTSYAWLPATLSIKAVENLKITIEGVAGPQLVGVDNISLRPGLCKNTPCEPSPCQNGGNCDDSNPPAGSKYVCTCIAGFSGDRCETTNHCFSSPCQNGGTCEVDIDGFTCSCPFAFSGIRCELPIFTDPCASSPCLNNGTCHVAGSCFYCSCPDGYTGVHCESVEPCSSNPCENGGSCVNTPDELKPYRCDCEDGFLGPNCEVFTCRFESKSERACFINTRIPRAKGWLRRSGPAPSKGTGPSRAFEGNYYFYFEATSKKRGNYNLFDKRNVPYKNATYCLHLHYHMYGGNTMGKFSIMTYSNENGYNLCAEVNGNQGEIWHHLLVELDLNSSTRIVLQAFKRTSAFRSDIAIDDVTLMPYPCSW
ncbi:uncharacterized protein LOC111132277 isoform X2 [Crassostrea virginica]